MMMTIRMVMRRVMMMMMTTIIMMMMRKILMMTVMITIDKDEDCDDNYHRSILGITSAG